MPGLFLGRRFGLVAAGAAGLFGAGRFRLAEAVELLVGLVGLALRAVDAGPLGLATGFFAGASYGLHCECK